MHTCTTVIQLAEHFRLQARSDVMTTAFNSICSELAVPVRISGQLFLNEFVENKASITHARLLWVTCYLD